MRIKKIFSFLSIPLSLITFFMVFQVLQKVNRIIKERAFCPALNNLTEETGGERSNIEVADQLTEINGELAKIRATLKESSQILGLETFEDDSYQLGSSSASPTVKPAGVLYYLTLIDTKNSANIYKESLYSSAVVGKILPGQIVPCFQRSGSWCLIETDGTRGWINAGLVKEVKKD